MKEKVVFSWSGGKDSALALYEIKKSKSYEITDLFTTVTKTYNRISMHGVREKLLDIQANSLSLSLNKIFISRNTLNKEYQSVMKEAMKKYKDSGVSKVVFADLFLREVRKYREDNLSKIGMKALFPLWRKNTAKLARRFIDLGFKSVITCIDSKALDKSFVGREFDEAFLRDLPGGIDPCGENGEFHSFVYDGPIFKEKTPYRKGKIVLRNNRFYYCDLLFSPKG